MKLKEELREIENQNSDVSDYSYTDPTDSQSKKKKRRKKRNIMQLESKEKGVSRIPKNLKSKVKKASGDSKKSKRTGGKRTRFSDLYDDVEAKFSVMERADRVLSHLENELPHFMKCMLPSNVAHGFWLHLPKKFCSVHLPNYDTSIMLVDEWGNEYKTSYLLGRYGLSAGWRGFSISHRLLKGDILIFHLTEPCKLKVRIVRVNGSDVVNAALCLMSMDASQRGTDSELVKKDERKRKKTKYVEPFPLDIPSSLKNVTAENVPNSFVGPVASRSASSGNSFCSKVIEGSRIKNEPQANDLWYPETSFLCDHSRKGVTCR